MFKQFIENPYLENAPLTKPSTNEEEAKE